MNITIHQDGERATHAIGERLDAGGLRFSRGASGYTCELLDGEATFHAHGAVGVMRLDDSIRIEPGTVIRIGEVAITVGYRVEALPCAERLDDRERELLGLVAAEPLDDAPRRVLADYWLERGDARGALIHAQCEGDAAATEALLAEHGELWLEPLRLAGFDDLAFERGFIPSLLLGKEPLATWPGLFRLSPAAYEIAMRRESHVTNQYGVVTMPALRRTAVGQQDVTIKYATHDSIEFIVREREIMSRFEGPNLARLLDTAHGRETLALVVADQPRLYREFARLKLDERAAISIGLDLSTALTELHALGLIHGELGFDHIAIANGVAVLHDFAFARGRAMPAMPTGVLAPHIHRYLAPEQMAAGRYERASDVWALAMVLGHLVLGHHPIHARDDYSLLMGIRNAEVEIPKTATGLGALLAKTLVVDPTLRPTAAQFHAEIIRL